MTGFRESDTGGIFGTWKGPGEAGDFRIKPCKDGQAATKRLEEQATKTKVDQLKSMGFPEELATKALNDAKGDVDSAIEALTRVLYGGEEATDTGSYQEPSAELLSQLTDMGFSVDQAKTALAVCENNLERAVEFLFSNS